MKRCSAFAYSICPDRSFCGKLEDAVFMDGSACDEFNEMHNAVTCRINQIAASCADHAVKTLRGEIRETLDRIMRELEELNAEN